MDELVALTTPLINQNSLPGTSASVEMPTIDFSALLNQEMEQMNPVETSTENQSNKNKVQVEDSLPQSEVTPNEVPVDSLEKETADQPVEEPTKLPEDKQEPNILTNLAHLPFLSNPQIKEEVILPTENLEVVSMTESIEEVGLKPIDTKVKEVISKNDMVKPELINTQDDAKKTDLDSKLPLKEFNQNLELASSKLTVNEKLPQGDSELKLASIQPKAGNQQNQISEPNVEENIELKPFIEAINNKLKVSETSFEETTELSQVSGKEVSELAQPVETLNQVSKNQIATNESVKIAPTNTEKIAFQQENVTDIVSSIKNESEFLVEGKTHQFKLSLKPDKLGDLDILLDVKDGKVTAKFLVETEKIKDLVKTSLPILQEALTKQNIVVEKADVSLNFSENSSFQFSGDLSGRQQHQSKLPKSTKLSQQYQTTDNYEETTRAGELDSVDILV
ncbi:flagellar hook-length control protein FliK [Vagococcus carniphilus]|uniref:flagellar hook-length control protein FliK n=1 Tax=Vagococcus carniphilus TaxID=218144 RepID=UPI00288D9BA5|nr:flagellar hook-length control protein FliK [Vagococcus carniphilus]MDT2815873.1 flagellar hook-length control protein FliK [Vagococcus carniphilus]MDT2865094.1 flagellar hook-length control protein FliK [Vagococcus carniphilus]